MATLRQYTNGSLELSFPMSPPVQCEHNCFLMDITVQLPHSTMHIQVLNPVNYI